MTWWEALTLGVIQGFTEFLPVSSSGHLVIGQALLGLRLPGITFEVLLHLATLLSVTVAYRARLISLARGALIERKGDDIRYLILLFVATVPAAVVGLSFGDQLEALFENPAVVGYGLLLTGTILLSSRWALAREGSVKIGAGAAVVIGLAQCLALVPGVSRSGTTVVTALWLGIAPLEAAAFSFLMSIPAIAGAGLLQLGEMGEGSGSSLPVLVLGAVAASVSGVLAIRTFVAMLRGRSFPRFAWYCWAMGIAFLTWVGLGLS